MRKESIEAKICEPAWAHQDAGFAPRLLLVDDEQKDLLRYSTLLKLQGYNVRTFQSHSEGADCLDQEPFDLVIVSQGSSAFEGRSVLARAMLKDPETPVLVMARTAEVLYYLEAMQMGAVEYLLKPLSGSEIVRMAAKYLHGRGRDAGSVVKAN